MWSDTEVAVSLNDNNVQIYTKQGKEWIVTETLSEVRVFLSTGPSATTDYLLP